MQAVVDTHQPTCITMRSTQVPHLCTTPRFACTSMATHERGAAWGPHAALSQWAPGDQYCTAPPPHSHGTQCERYVNTLGNDF